MQRAARPPLGGAALPALLQLAGEGGAYAAAAAQVAAAAQATAPEITAADSAPPEASAPPAPSGGGLDVEEIFLCPITQV